MMFNPQYIAFATLAVVIFTVYMALLHLVFSNNKSKDRLKNSVATGYNADNAEETPPPFAVLSEWALSFLKIDANIRKTTTLWLSQAGIESHYAISYYFFFCRFIQPLILIAGIMSIFSLFKSTGIMDGLLHLITTLCLIIAGLRGAKLYVNNLHQKRMEHLLYSFPETLDLLLVCIESGLGLDAALNRVCKELRDVHPIVVAELDRVRLELTMLNDRSQALQNLADRINVVSFKTLAAALIQTEKFGTSLVDTLRVLSEEQRLARLYAAEQKAARIPVLITIPLILCIMPAFIMILIGPPIVKVINQGGLLNGSTTTQKR